MKLTDQKKVVFPSLHKGKHILLFLYIAIVVLRFLPALCTRNYATINIDEFLYTGLAKSIAGGNGITFRGQKADYFYILYPLLLSPIYAIFPEGNSLYRALQLWSIALMSLSVFPLWALARNFTYGNDESKTKHLFSLVCMAMLLPDFIIGEVFLSECVLYPLFFTAALVSWRQTVKPDLRRSLLLGAIALLMFMAKPGAIVFPAIMLICIPLFAETGSRKKAFIYSLAGIAVCGAALLCFVSLFSGENGFLAVYKQQLTERATGLHIGRFFRAVALYPYIFIIAGGIGSVIFPLFHTDELSRQQKNYAIGCIIALFVTMIGTSWTINRHEYATDTMHLRYLAMYIPLFMITTAACLVSGTGNRLSGKGTHILQTKREKYTLILLLAYMAICTVCGGLSACSDENSSPIAFFSFGLVKKSVLPHNSAIVCSYLLLLLIVIVCLDAANHRKKKHPLVFTVLIITFAVNNIVSYHSMRTPDKAMNYPDEFYQSIDEDYLYVTTNEHKIECSSLETNSKANGSYVFWNDFFNFLYAGKGTYAPFQPTSPFRGTLIDRATPDSTTIILDSTVAPLIHLSNSAKAFSSPDGRLCITHCTPGEPWADCVLANVTDKVLDKGTPGILVIFNDEISSRPISVRLHIEAGANGKVRFFSNGEEKCADYTVGEQWLDFEFTRAAEAFNFATDECDLKLIEYEIIC